MSSFPLFVIGHQNPDTDSIASAIGYAEFLQQTKKDENILAACCGPLNARTQWMVDRAGVAEPKLVIDVRPTAISACRHVLEAAKLEDSFMDVYRKLDQQGWRSMPLVNEENQVVGLVELSELLALLVPEVNSLQDSLANRRIITRLRMLVRVLQGNVLHDVEVDTEEEFTLLVAASNEDIISNRLHLYQKERILFVVGDRPAAQKEAIYAGVRAILLTGDAPFTEDLQLLAKEKKVAVLRCYQDTASAVSLIRCAQPAKLAVEEQVETIKSNELLSSVQAKVTSSNQTLFPVVDAQDNTLVGVLSKSDLLEPRRQKLILVDHNEFSQAVEGANEAEIVEVLDHHRLSGDLITKEPVRFINEIIGSTSTMVASAFRDAGLKPKPATALCLMGGMISDTLNLTSPTTTDKDREILPWLAEIAGEEIEEFTQEFFSAGSMLKELATAELLNADRKTYMEAGVSLSISQIEELGLEHLESRREDLQKGLQELCAQQNLDAAFLLITDIARHRSILLVSAQERILRQIDYPLDAKGDFLLAGVVSRKKQFFPYLANRLAELQV